MSILGNYNLHWCLWDISSHGTFYLALSLENTCNFEKIRRVYVLQYLSFRESFFSQVSERNYLMVHNHLISVSEEI